MRRWFSALALIATACSTGSVTAPTDAAALIDTPVTTTTRVGLALDQAGAPITPEPSDTAWEPPQVLVASHPFAYPPRAVTEQAWSPFAEVGDVVLHHPSRHVETIGFHESANDGAQQMKVLDGAAAPYTMESRGRGNGSRTAADIAADPGEEIRSPVTGTVLRAGTYVLYCRYSDDFAVIEPDVRPGWEVKVLHIENVRVRAGDRVVAGETLLADGPRRLPFGSQVDAGTSSPSWPHVHIEVVDPSIPDRPGSGC